MLTTSDLPQAPDKAAYCIMVESQPENQAHEIMRPLPRLSKVQDLNQSNGNQTTNYGQSIETTQKNFSLWIKIDIFYLLSELPPMSTN